MAQFSLKPIITFFVVIILGIVFLSVIADNEIANTELSDVTNESITIASGTGNTANADVVSLAFFGNATTSSDASSDVTLSLGANINFTKAGVITLNGTFADGIYNASYGYEGDLYVVDTKSHFALKLVALFFVFVIVAFGIKAIAESSDNFNFGFGRVK